MPVDLRSASMFLNFTLNPGLRFLSATTDVESSDDARVLLLTTAMQESALLFRRQVGGPARSFWQFELNGGVNGVCANPQTAQKIGAVCSALNIPNDYEVIFEAMAWNDILAVAMARLNYWKNPNPLPAADDPAGAWAYYLQTWRPGTPRALPWADYHGLARSAVFGG